jgi:putative membrane protein insertion efficiency factor
MSQTDFGDDANSLVEGVTEHDHVPVPVDGSGRRSGGLISAIRTYQLARSGRITGCRYLPTCSEYAVEAIDVHGAARGTWLAIRRISRCGPWGGHGFDPVPERSAP